MFLTHTIELHKNNNVLTKLALDKMHVSNTL